MRSKVYLLGAGICLAAALFTGCGGEYAGKTEGDAVSGGAVSGQAVSDAAISGPALQDEGNKSFVSGKENSKYRFCNDSHLYYMEYDLEPIMEYSLLDGSRREIKFGREQLGAEARIGAVCYVDNDWVWYVKQVDTPVAFPAYQAELWRAPVENGELNIGKEEFVFSDPLFMNEKETYCDGRYVVYTAGADLSSYYRKYDLKEKKYIFNAEPDVDEDEVDRIIAVTRRAAFVDGYDGFFRQDFDSAEKVMIVKDEIIDDKVAVTDTDLFYMQECEESDTEEYYNNIWQYHLEDGSKKEIITNEQIMKVLKEKGFLKDSKKLEIAEYLFVSGDRLYVQVSLGWKENGVLVSKKVVLSQKIGSKDGLCYEKGLTECLANPKNNQKKFEKIYDDEEDEGEMSLFLSRGTCLYMSEKKCFLYLYDPEQNKNRVACYDFSTGSMKFLTKKDPDWYVPFYDGAQPDWRETVYPDDIRPDMPNNKEVDWPYW